uniref:Ribosomal RNA methyltransferase FtsJ domain-containing protein n=1 Tax=viral metagenome TaxID=1070528 RepID=A0A6C0C5I8_9ZZZZ
MLIGGNVATHFNIFTNDIIIEKIEKSKSNDISDIVTAMDSVDKDMYDVLSFPTMILTESAKKKLEMLFDKLNGTKNDNVKELKRLLNKQYFMNYFGSVFVYEYIYVLKFIGLHKNDKVLFISSNANFVHGFIEYANDKYENKFDTKNILLLLLSKNTTNMDVIEQYHIPFHQMDQNTYANKYNIVTLDASDITNSDFGNIFVMIHNALLSLETNGTLIMHIPYITQKYVFCMISAISKMFKKQAIFKENDFATPGSFFHMIVFKGFKMDNDVMDVLKKVNELNKEDSGVSIICNLKESDYSVYSKIIKEEINKNITKGKNAVQTTSNILDLDNLIKVTKMNYDYSISVIRNKFSDINIMHPFVWEKTDTYMLDIFSSIEKEDVKGHMYIIEYRKSDIVDSEYIDVVKKQLRYINEYTYQYVSKSNYKKYKQAELFFNSEYKILNKKLAIEYDITINGNYVSRAWMKMYEMIMQCNFVESFGHKITGFHICEAPGNFINAMIYHIHSKGKQYEWHAQSLNPDLPGNKDAFMDEYGFIKKTRKNWDFGVDNSGDILNLENFRYYINKYKGVDVLIGDCGEQWTGEKKRKWPDKTDKRGVRDLGTGQMLYALNIPRQGGNCIIKTYSGNLDPVFLTLLELMASSYSKIIFFKSNLNFWSAEVYIVGINFLGPSKDIEKMTNDFIDGNLSPLPKISRYTFSQYVTLSERILHQVFMYKSFFVYCSLFPVDLEKNKFEFQKIIKHKMDLWMQINFKDLK